VARHAANNGISAVTLSAGPGELVTSGPLMVAIPVAMAAGLVSFLSPCCLPLLPGYLAYVSGSAGADNLARQNQSSNIRIGASWVGHRTNTSAGRRQPWLRAAPTSSSPRLGDPRVTGCAPGAEVVKFRL
jgi:hypothetical protein